MKILLTLLAAGLVSTAAFALSSADVTGTWDLEMRWSGDVRSTGTCTFRQEGQKLMGTCGGAAQFPIEGEVRDDSVSWQFDVEQDGAKGRMEFAGDLDVQGTTIEGVCSIVGGQDGSFTMKKQS